MNVRVLGFTFVASVLTGILFGLVPALQISRPDVQETIRETGRGVSGNRRQSRFRQALIVVEVALSGYSLLTGEWLESQNCCPAIFHV